MEAPSAPRPGVSADKISAARLSVVSNTLLVFLKLAVGMKIGSVAVLSEAAHSATDLVAALIAFWAVRAADAPPDLRHPYGHGKMESVSGVGEACLILLAGALVVWEAATTLRFGRAHDGVGWGVAVMALSGAVNFWVSRHLMRVARETESIALEADAHHLRIDVWTSVGVTVGLLLVSVTGLPFLDPLVALLIGGLILFSGWQVLSRAFFPLLDERLPDAELRQIQRILNEHPQILDWHKLRTRKAGSVRHIDVHILVDDDLSLREAHRLTEDLEDRLRDTFPNAEVMVHTEPYEEEKRHQEETPHERAARLHVERKGEPS